MRRIVTTALATLLGGLTLAVMPAGPAIAGSLPTIISPAQGSQVPLGTNELTVEFSSAGTFDIEIYDDYYEYDWFGSFTVDAGQQTFTIDPLNTTGAYTIEVVGQAYDDGEDYATFTVVPGPTTLTSVSIAPSTFYPRVRDGYKDNTITSFRLNRGANLTARVYRQSDGYQVLNADAGWRYSGARTWSWDGRGNNGYAVSTGGYRIDLTATGSDGTEAVARVYVQVATGYVTKRITKSRRGANTSSVAVRGNCYARRHYWNDGDIFLDCWYSDYAQATYRYALPANAHDVSWGVNGATYCCRYGQIVKSGKRVSTTVFQVRVKVTYARAYAVNSTRITYTTRVRI